MILNNYKLDYKTLDSTMSLRSIDTDGVVLEAIENRM